MAAFPTNIIPIISGYGFGSSNNVKSIDVAGGAPIYVKEFKYGPVILNVQLVGTRLMKMVFSDFLYHDINAGADSFTMTLDSGLGLEEHTVKIIPGSLSFNGSNDPTWSINFNIIAERTPAQDAPFEGSLVALYDVYGEDIEDFFEALGVFTLEDLTDYFGA